MRWIELPEFDTPPPGWCRTVLQKEADFVFGQSPDSEHYNEQGEGLPFLQGNADFTDEFPQTAISTRQAGKKCEPRDTLVSVRAPVGDINMASEECCIGRGVAAVRHKSGATSFTYHSMSNLYPDFARFEAEGTVFGSINKDGFEKLRFVIPPTEIIAAYERQSASGSAVRGERRRPGILPEHQP